MRIMVVGASRGLGRALVDGLVVEHNVIGVSRIKPTDFNINSENSIQWIEVDMTNPLVAVKEIVEKSPSELDVIIYNLGIWEAHAFDDAYRFENDTDNSIVEMVGVNITGAILLLKHLVPRLFGSKKPQVILTGSTSGLRQSGRPEVTFGASKHALNGIADALREGFREKSLAVTCLQLGYLNTEDSLAAPVQDAVVHGQGELIPVHDVVAVVRTIISLSSSSFVREITMPAILDERF